MARLLLLLFFATGFLRAEESYSQQIVRENRTRRLVAALGEVEVFKQQVIDAIQLFHKEHPGGSMMFWSKVGSSIDTEPFETAIIQHYSQQFTLEELGHLDDLLKVPAMRGIFYRIRTAPLDPEGQKEAFEKIKKNYPPEVVLEFGLLINSALGRQLIDAGRTAEPIRNEQGIAAISAAIKKAS